MIEKVEEKNIRNIRGTEKLSKEQERIWHMCEKAHRNIYENCPFGKVIKVWLEEGVVCVKYENGDWFHYNDSCEWY